MGFGVFMHRADSIYVDVPSQQYQFPRQYLGRASGCLGDWVVYLEPSKVRATRGYFAVAHIEKIVPDPTAAGMFLALITPGSYLDFASPVPFVGPKGMVEQGLLNEAGRLSGRAQAAVRPLSAADFNRITSLGLAEAKPVLPRIGDLPVNPDDAPAAPVTEQVRDRIASLGSRLIRDRVFRKVVLQAYDARCAITGLKLIYGGGRAEVEAAHIQPVEHHGPDDVRNGLALSGTAHWMFDRGLISLDDDLNVLVSRQANDRDSIRALINHTGRALPPSRLHDRPHPQFLRWHRENCFKA